MLRWFGTAAVVVGLVVVPAAFSDSSVWFRDAEGDIKPGAAPDFSYRGPDITFVRGTERSGRITFKVAFADAPPLPVSERDQSHEWVRISIWPTGKVGKKQPLYDVWADRSNVSVINVRRPKAREIYLSPLIISGKTVTFSVPTRLIGNPKRIRFSATAHHEGKVDGGWDYAPDKGTSPLWVF